MEMLRNARIAAEGLTDWRKLGQGLPDPDGNKACVRTSQEHG